MNRKMIKEQTPITALLFNHLKKMTSGRVCELIRELKNAANSTCANSESEFHNKEILYVMLVMILWFTLLVRVQILF